MFSKGPLCYRTVCLLSPLAPGLSENVELESERFGFRGLTVENSWGLGILVFVRDVLSAFRL